MPGTAELTLDFGALEYISSAGLRVLLMAFAITCVFTYAVQTKMSENASGNLLAITRSVATAIDGADAVDDALLAELAEECDVSEIDVIDNRGVVRMCTNPDFVGFGLHSGEQSRPFLVLLEGKDEYVQGYRPIARDENISRKCAGVALERGGTVQVGYAAPRFQRDIDSAVVGATRNRHVDEEGYLII